MRKMKDSGIEWIGEIPESWDVSKLLYFLRSSKASVLVKLLFMYVPLFFIICYFYKPTS